MKRMMTRRKSFRGLTTFGVGGQAAYYRRVDTPELLVAAVQAAQKARLPFFVLAGGSNVIAPSGRWPGILIHYFRKQGGISSKGRAVTAEAGVSLARLISFAIRRGLGGLETLSGIPGTVGGAIVGNAGAYGQCISDCLVSVQIWDGRKSRWLAKKQCRFSYRESIFKKKPWLILRARFRLTPANSRELENKSRGIIAKRLKKYPADLRCPGSFFKNVLTKDVSRVTLAKIDPAKIIDGKIPAGYLLEQVGACGMKTEHLEVASYHGNLIINRGKATAAEIKKLAADLKNRVRKKFGIRLEEEVRYVL